MEKKAFQYKLIESLEQFQKNTAVEYGDNVPTYRDLDEKSNCIANWLIHKGVNRDAQVGIKIENRVDFIVTLIGVLKAGAVFVPLTSDYPEERLSAMIEAVDIRLIIGDRGGNPAGPEVFVFDEILLNREPMWFTTRPDIAYDPEDKIYIYFTSGSTGKPKAILGKNKSLLHFIQWEIETFNIHHRSRGSQLITPGFDAFLRDLFVPLLAGGTVCIPPHTDIIVNAEELIRWVDKTGVSLIHCVPSLFRLLDSGELTPDNFKDLKYIMLSGEPIIPAELAGWYDTFGQRIQLVNFYGPTETTMIKSFYPIKETDVDKERIPIGKPIKGARLIVCDENLELCDKLITGEIYIRTPFRTFGYYNEPGLNNERFIPNPFTNNPGDILYKTGDLGRLLPDGNIEFLGRVDRQVKVRGIRIELEEIEHALIGHPAVKDAAVIKKESGSTALLVGFVTMSGEENGIKNYLAGKLPEYMIPNSIVKIEEFPRKPNGKIDYDLLPDLLLDESDAYKAPRNKLESKLLDIWHEILEVEKIGVLHNFFECGGNSLNVMALLSKIHREFDIRIPLGEIFDNPTIEQQAAIIGHSMRDAFHSIKKAEVKEYYSLSSAQKRLYVLQGMDPHSLSYNSPMVVFLEGDLDRRKLKETFEKLIQRHESFRTSFELVDGEPVQKIHKEVPFDVEYYEAGDARGDEKYIPKEFFRVFDLTRAPLMRVGLASAAENKYTLMVDLHHIITDGISMGLLIQQFGALYSGEELPPLKLQYRDYAEWQNSEEQKEAKKSQEAYWVDQFSGDLPVLNLPTDFERPEMKSFEGGALPFVVGREELNGLKEIALEEGTTLFIVLLSVFYVMLHKIGGQEDIIVGTPIAGRHHDDLEQVIGMLVNTLVLRNFPKSDHTFREFLRDVKSRVLDAFENQDYQFEDLVEKLEVEKDTGRNPLFDVMFGLQTTVGADVEMPGLNAVQYEIDPGTSKFDMTLNSMESRGELHCTFEYCTKLFKREKIERFINYFKDIISNILTDKDIQLKAITVYHDLESIQTTELEMDFGF